VPRDDMALLVLRVPPAGASGLPPYPVYTAEYPAEVESVPRARREFVTWFTDEVGQPADAETVLILAELVANAARAARTGFEVHARILDDSIEIEVVDDGPGLTGELPPADVAPDPEAEQGRGLYLVRLMADELSIASDGRRTRARCRRRLTAARRPPVR
ncbi:MAG TPA: ATP-binding protein, partial [Acidimicrobiales bacterium]|nr:ATP-binding protein [Acidimicrobiales bacterium]